MAGQAYFSLGGEPRKAAIRKHSREFSIVVPHFYLQKKQRFPMPRKYSLVLVTKWFFSWHNFFFLQQFFSSLLNLIPKKIRCAEKKILAARKKYIEKKKYWH